MRRLALVLALLCAGCAGAFQKPDPAADYGAAPDPAEVDEAVRAYFHERLYDPFSAEYEYGDPVRAYAHNGLGYGGKVRCYGYAVPVRVNAKNRMGGYTGWKDWLAVFDDGRLCGIWEGRKHLLVHRVE